MGQSYPPTETGCDVREEEVDAVGREDVGRAERREEWSGAGGRGAAGVRDSDRVGFEPVRRPDALPLIL